MPKSRTTWALNLPSEELAILNQGASIYDVRTEGGGGVSPKEDVVREFA